MLMAVLLNRRKCLVCNVVKTPLFYFPKDSTRLMSWLDILQRTRLLQLCSAQYLRNNARICNEHFEEKMFTSTLRNRLLYTAEPKGTENVSAPNPVDPSPVSMLPIILSEDVSTGASIITPITQSPTREMTSTRIIITTTTTRQVTPKTREIFRLRSNLSKREFESLKMEYKRNCDNNGCSNNLTNYDDSFFTFPKGQPESRTIVQNTNLHGGTSKEESKIGATVEINNMYIKEEIVEELDCDEVIEECQDEILNTERRLEFQIKERVIIVQEKINELKKALESVQELTGSTDLTKLYLKKYDTDFRKFL